jgi:hypothetical protein
VLRRLSTLRARLTASKPARYAALAATFAISLLAAAVVSSLTVDLGPSVRATAERFASNRLKREVAIGGLEVRVLTGRVLVNDIRIAGRRPEDRPFFTASRLSVALDWRTAFRRRPEILVTGVELADWDMLVEQFSDGHSFPDFTPDDDDEADGPRRFTTTLRFLRASNGRFTYVDHNSPWSIVAPNIDLRISNKPRYQGEATVTGGTVAIQDHLPMWVNMKAKFTIDGSRLGMERIDLESDGAKSVAIGTVDLAKWPEMRYEVTSRVQFQRMREIFFARESWQLSGEGDFNGTFHLFKGGHELAGGFTSPLAGVNAFRFPALHGSLKWTRALFEVTSAGADLYGGKAQFGFSIVRHRPNPRSTALFNVTYEGVELGQLSDLYELPGQRFAGSASGDNVLEWPIGRFSDVVGRGRIELAPPPGVVVMGPALEPSPAAPEPALLARGEDIPPLRAYLPVSGRTSYRFDPEIIELSDGRFATEQTFVSFDGSTRWGEDSRFPFRVASGDWQESDQVLAGILTALGSRTGAVKFGGRGTFDGVMVGRIRRPRVEGVFTGSGMRAWDTVWGDGSASIVVENSYVSIKSGTVRHHGAEIRAEGLFSLGYPRKDGGDEIDARIRVTGKDVASLRHAFELDDYPVSGRMTGEFHLTGRYQQPIGFGAMTIDGGVAYGEPFERGTAALRFDGAGIRLDGVSIVKGAGAVTGAAFVGWDGSYSFNADGRRIPVESLAVATYPQAQPSGVIEFGASGSATFANPRYDVRFRVIDLFVAEEGVGQVTGTLNLRGGELSGEIDAASPRLAVTGTGRIALTTPPTGELTFRFHDSSLDPYVRLFVPTLSPFTTAVASGAIRVTGELTSIDRLVVDGTVDRLNMRLFDYAVTNAAPIRLALDRSVVKVQQLILTGDETRLSVGGTVALGDQHIALKAEGDANLAVLQGFFRNVRGSGRAELVASIDGPLANPAFSGSATVTGGRIRHFSLPSSFDAINGTVRFDQRSLSLDDVTATLGGGRVQLGGRVGLEGYLPGELNVTARGEGMQLRYPEGVRSTIDADLTVRGNIKAPTLGGTVLVKNALWSRRIDPTGGLLDFGGSSSSANGQAAVPLVPVRFDIQVQVPSTLRIQNNLARLVASADLQLAGTLARPLLFGRAEVDRGEVSFEGRRYLVTRGAIDFTNPTRIEPFLDVEAETRVRVPGQTYRVIVSAAGTLDRLRPDLQSDPPLPTGDVLALLFSDVRRGTGPADVELRALQNPNQRESDILTTRATQLLANPISSEVGRVVEQTFGVDTFQLTPSLFDPYSRTSTTRVNPAARVTIGKRISERVYLTFSRSVSTSISDQILLLEYDESDRFSWILSRNEDQTYAIEVRVRHAF